MRKGKERRERKEKDPQGQQSEQWPVKWRLRQKGRRRRGWGGAANSKRNARNDISRPVGCERKIGKPERPGRMSAREM